VTDDVYISFSDIESFLRCRQLWDFKSANRQSIRHKTSPKLYLDVGTAIHKALEANFNGYNPVYAVNAYGKEVYDEKVALYTEHYGMKPWPQETKEIEEAFDLAHDLVVQYFDHYGLSNPLGDAGLTSIGCEIPFKIDITEYIGWNIARPGQKVYFCGTLDNIAVDEHENLWIVENKTYTSKPSPEDVQWHFQSQGYAVAVEWLTGMPVTGVLYNGIAKKPIQEPKVLKNGLLSTDKRQSTTLERYCQAIANNGEDPEDARFEAILSHLRDIDKQGDTRFFYREKAFFTREQLESWKEGFQNVVVEMLDNPRVYRTIPYKGCSDCWFSDLCHTKHSGGDVEYLLEKRYTTGTYGTVEEVRGVEPAQITSVEELREYLSNVG